MADSKWVVIKKTYQLGLSKVTMYVAMSEKDWMQDDCESRIITTGSKSKCEAHADKKNKKNQK